MNNSRLQLQGMMASYPKVLKKEQERGAIDAAMSALYASTTPQQRKQCETLLFEGIKLYERDQNDAAYAKFEECKAVYANGDAWHHQGVINFQRENFERAFEEFSAAILLYKDYASAYRYRALSILLLLEENGQLNQSSDLINFAKSNLRKAIELGDEAAREVQEQFFN